MSFVLNGNYEFVDAGECADELITLRKENRELREENARLRYAGERLSAALSRIDYVMGPENDQHVSMYDVDCHEERVAESVKTLYLNLQTCHSAFRYILGNSLSHYATMEKATKTLDWNKWAEHMIAYATLCGTGGSINGNYQRMMFVTAMHDILEESRMKLLALHATHEGSHHSLDMKDGIDQCIVDLSSFLVNQCCKLKTLITELQNLN